MVDEFKWDKRLLNMALDISTWSKDKRTKVGCVIVDSDRIPLGWGYNGMPRGVDDSVQSRYERPQKHYFFEHAERNAIDNSKGSLKGSVLYVTHHPCAPCVRGAIQNKIARIVVDKANGINGPLAERHKEEYAAAREMLAEVGIEIIEIDLCS